MLYVSYHKKNKCYGNRNFFTERGNLSSCKSSVLCFGTSPDTGSVQLCPLNALTPVISV